MNVEEQALIDPIVKNDKFTEIQEVVNQLDALFEAS
jgi:hypothetical protein